MNKLYIPPLRANNLASDFFNYRFDSIRFGQKLEMMREQDQPQVFNPNEPLHYYGDYKTTRIMKSLSKETTKYLFGVKFVIMLNFCNEKVTFIVFILKM